MGDVRTKPQIRTFLQGDELPSFTKTFPFPLPFKKDCLTLQHGKVYQSLYRHRVQVLKNMDTLNRLPWAAQNAVFQRLEEIAEVSATSSSEQVVPDVVQSLLGAGDSISDEDLNARKAYQQYLEGKYK